jgi:hypothetical protein
MSFQFHLGRLPAGRPQPVSSDRRSLVVLGDFSSRADRGMAPRDRAALRTSRPRALDVDTLEPLIASLAEPLTLALGEGDGGLSVTLNARSVDDLHPDALLEQLPIFQPLLDLRRRLEDPRQFADAAAEVRRWWPAAAPASAAPASPAAEADTGGDDLMRLLGRPATAAPARSAAGEALDALLRDIIAPHRLPPTSPDAPALIATVDDALAATLRAVLHHPLFRRREVAWRSLAFLASRIETDTQVHLQVLDWSAAEFATDVLEGEDLDQSALWRLLIEQPAEDDHLPRPAALFVCYPFDTAPAATELLARAAQLAAAAGIAFIGSLDDPALRDEAALPAAHGDCWQALRALPETSHLALAAPRFLLRNTYGRRGERVERIAFEEDTGGPNPPPLPWGAPPLLAAVLLGRHLMDNGADEPPGEPLSIDNLPIVLRTDADGDTVALPCTEWLLTERSTAAVQSLGVTPVLTRRGADALRWGGWYALSGEALAGPWSA